ncbi:MAG: hypothetical protein J3Q66DRAFT_426171 [Benniella sp.]|nr:MAG: hypothetical protein J3Q66DRAFT_426171 [Benniella sp.]
MYATRVIMQQQPKLSRATTTAPSEPLNGLCRVDLPSSSSTSPLVCLPISVSQGSTTMPIQCLGPTYERLCGVTGHYPGLAVNERVFLDPRLNPIRSRNLQKVNGRSRDSQCGEQHQKEGLIVSPGESTLSEGKEGEQPSSNEKGTSSDEESSTPALPTKTQRRRGRITGRSHCLQDVKSLELLGSSSPLSLRSEDEQEDGFISDFEEDDERLLKPTRPPRTNHSSAKVKPAFECEGDAFVANKYHKTSTLLIADDSNDDENAQERVDVEKNGRISDPLAYMQERGIMSDKRVRSAERTLHHWRGSSSRHSITDYPAPSEEVMQRPESREKEEGASDEETNRPRSGIDCQSLDKCGQDTSTVRLPSMERSANNDFKIYVVEGCQYPQDPQSSTSNAIHRDQNDSRNDDDRILESQVHSPSSPLPLTETIEVGPNYVPVLNGTVRVTCENCLRRFTLSTSNPHVLERHQRRFCSTATQQRLQRLYYRIETYLGIGLTGREATIANAKRKKEQRYRQKMQKLNDEMDGAMVRLMALHDEHEAYLKTVSGGNFRNIFRLEGITTLELATTASSDGPVEWTLRNACWHLIAKRARAVHDQLALPSFPSSLLSRMWREEETSVDSDDDDDIFFEALESIDMQ